MTAPVFSVAGAVNFRDLGGHRTPSGAVRSGRVFRSASLAYLDPEEAAQLAREAGIEVVLDLRSDQEVEERPLTTIEQAGVTVHRIPVLDGLHADAESFEWQDLTLVGLYQLMLERCADGFVAATRMVADSSHHPLVFQCAAGKDRTGVLAALVLATLGVDEESIVSDYTRTAEVIDVIRQRDAALRRDREVPERFLSVDAETMRALLAGLRDEYGSVTGYLDAHGLEPGAAEALRAALVTRSG
jgi:protein-tyrosine phosphatase